jgi:Ser/Thr protein kinase RdoA (MazF antagonist)
MVKEQKMFGPTKECPAIASFLENNYNFKVISDISQYLGKTASSKLYFAKTKSGPILVKKSLWYEFAEDGGKQSLEKVYVISELLRKSGLPLIKAFSNNDGNLISQIDSIPAVVLEYVSGLNCSFSDREFSSSGSALGKFHKEGKNYLRNHSKEEEKIREIVPVEKPYEESREIYFNCLRKDMRALHQCNLPEVCRVVRENILNIDEIIKFIDSSGINNKSRISGILHNDFNTDNCFYNKEGNLIAILDIDQLGIGPLVWDIGNTLASFGWKMASQYPKLNFETKTKLFLQAYHKEFPLPLSEYLFVLAAAQRWDIMRILRSLRRHYYENNRLPGLLPKIKGYLIPRILYSPKMFSFLTAEWLKRNLS